MYTSIVEPTKYQRDAIGFQRVNDLMCDLSTSKHQNFLLTLKNELATFQVNSMEVDGIGLLSFIISYPINHQIDQAFIALKNAVLSKAFNDPQDLGKALCFSQNIDNLGIKALLAISEPMKTFDAMGPMYLIPGYDGTNFLHMAASRASKEDIANVLNKTPQQYVDIALQTQDKYGRTPLHWAAMCQNIDNLDIIMNHYNVGVSAAADACILLDQPAGLFSSVGDTVFDYLSSNLTKPENQKLGFRAILKRFFKSLNSINSTFITKIIRYAYTKDALYELIKDEPDTDEKLKLIDEALGKDTPLGFIMWSSRGFMSCDLNRGVLLKLKELRKKVAESLIGNHELAEIKFHHVN